MMFYRYKKATNNAFDADFAFPYDEAREDETDGENQSRSSS
jgi:hypothetical protein